ncbi:phosphoribosylanthranilate isomerase [Intestinibacillus massiliensis]|uniref:phosphoribosylanthranilate isomerase n=1 Tax=Intestinibacillus massiliensis TaxID=1871029 RepID=UPI000B34B83E|nr:phosphoribosylanthranilate isomerase [Intestinibacillus massiliensis]
MKLKFCGVRRPEDIAYVNAAPPDYVGFVFAQSRRQVTAGQAAALSEHLRPAIQTVGVFVNEPLERLLAAAETAGLSVLQLHGDEDARYIEAVRRRWHGPVWKAVRVRAAADIREAERLPVDALVLDAFSPHAYGGTGQTADFDVIARNRPSLPFFLAGGISAANVQDAIRAVQPDGIDLSGGIETGGAKDAEKIKQIYQLIRGA